MKRLLVGTIAGGAILSAFALSPWPPSDGATLWANLLAGFLATLLLLQLGPRSFVEKILFLLTAATLAWAGRAPWDRTAGTWLAMSVAWTFTGAALAWLTRPRTE